MHKTILLCFIHGFKGGDDTFAGFPQRLRSSLSHALPKVSVRTVVYPKFETRGDLSDCVGRFRDWLQNAVIDLEVANGTPSPTIDPSVRVLLVGHSMGGIVAAETYLAIASESPIPRSSDSKAENVDVENHAFMFPYIQGVLAFDTPYLGIAPGVVAHGAESHFQTATSAYTALSSAASAFGFGGTGGRSNPTSPSPGMQTSKFLTGSANPVDTAAATTGSGSRSMTSSVTDADGDAAATPAWQRWGRYAMFAGAVGAAAAGGAAAYVNRDALSSGWTWATSHMEFVGCLVRAEELKQRLGSLIEGGDARGTGFLNFYTTLGMQADRAGTQVAGGFVEVGAASGAKRTFCNLPASRPDWMERFKPAPNDKAPDEVEAHMSMFVPRENPGFYALSDAARDAVLGWVDEHWYESSEPAPKAAGAEAGEHNAAVGGIGGGGKDREEAEHLGGEEPVLL